MAELIPNFFGSGPQAECYVFRALELNLPEGWSVWWSLAYSDLEEGLPAGEGEVDFLCFHPQHGLLVLEVKGGEVLCTREGWFQNGRKMRASPAEQATRNAHALLRILCRELAVAPFPLPLCHAVWLPFSLRPAHEPIDLQGITLYAEDLPHPEAAFCRLFASLRATIFQPSAPLSIEAGEALRVRLRTLFAPRVAYRPGWSQRRLLSDASLARLTQDQAVAFDAFSQFPRLRVRGCAGSGKTLLALRRAAQLAAEGKRVLLLCFNLLLAEHLRNVTAPEPRIRAVAIYDLLCELLGRQDDGSREFWHTLARDAVPVAKAFAERSPYDCVIVDEGQDFSPALWQVVSALVPERSGFIVFYDPAQNIFQRNLEAIPAFPWPEAKLTTNCRNTRTVFDLLKPYAGEATRILPSAPPGEPCEHYRFPTRAKLREHLAALLCQLTEVQAIPVRDILLLGAHVLPKMDLDPLLAAFPGLRYFTYRKFKGLEAPILILLDVTENDPAWNGPALYTAISRAVHKVIFLRLA